MASTNRSSSSLFEVYLRLRPPPPANCQSERFLSVEETEDDSCPTHITVNPPNDRRRNVEKFEFTRVFDEESSQLDVFHRTGVSSLVEGVLAPHGGDGTDALLATLGVTGSGKTHTILGSRTQRGMTQLALDVIFRSIGSNLVDSNTCPALEASLQASDASEAMIITAGAFLDSTYDLSGSTRAPSRAATPMLGEHVPPPTPLRLRQRPSGLSQSPDVSAVNVSSDPSAEYAVIISMYELYLDRIYDLLTPAIKSAATKEYRRRPLLFKSTEMSPDRKVVAGLRKVVCNNLKDALTVLEAGLQERRIAGTGSNSVSSRSHGFFCIEVKKRRKSRNPGPWGGSTLTIVDLAGSERARDAKTQGATLAEAGKINESLMYLGQCLQMQSDASSSTKPNMVPFRQCKLTEVLFSNSFPSHSLNQVTAPTRNPQKAVMIVTVDPLGDFNATCQILRYSTLAREVTVPRIPSLSQAMLASQIGPQQPFTSPLASPSGQHRPFFATTHGGGGGSGSYRNFSGSHDGDRATMELAALEIARMTEEIEALRAEASREREARLAAEAHLLTMEDRMLDMEQAVREECVTEFEERLALELARCKASLAVEQERGEEHWDRKVEVMERGLGFGAGAESDDGDDKENVLVENLEEEIERLRRDNAVLRRELVGRSPSKRKPLQEREDFAEAASLGRKMERLRVSNESSASVGSAGPGSPKKVRRIGGKRWDEDEAVF